MYGRKYPIIVFMIFMRMIEVDASIRPFNLPVLSELQIATVEHHAHHGVFMLVPKCGPIAYIIAGFTDENIAEIVCFKFRGQVVPLLKRYDRVIVIQCIQAVGNLRRIKK